MSAQILDFAALAAKREWPLDLLGEGRAAELVRALAASPRPGDRRAALAQLDRLPEWLDLLLAWLDRPGDDALALEALEGATRLAGPYAQLTLRTYLRRGIARALDSDSPADGLWGLSLRVARWLRQQPGLASLPLEMGNPGSALGRAPEALRDFSRRIEAAGRVDGALAEELALWPASPPAPRPEETRPDRRGEGRPLPLRGAARPARIQPDAGPARKVA